MQGKGPDMAVAAPLRGSEARLVVFGVLRDLDIPLFFFPFSFFFLSLWGETAGCRGRRGCTVHVRVDGRDAGMRIFALVMTFE